ncbi:type II toxin-antitoxin system HicA family toxin [Solitalea sp. MAHUQ-68]|uniref:Type II toxin-antitoxin system HicA family toxin n=1 Tax=Solitalea agri TaxID=2953739 RepID=A0A9X2F8L1_9SPHI|nr:type II toxin-antitoxin system HicA family toxin [Solitalea agri]MCO4294346.1 type II toxin-antitoxin system HicA family toxin [Solitalea agri]
MSNTPSLTSKEIIKILLRKGFILERTKGSHQLFFHPDSKRRVIVPMHNRDLPKGTFYSILKQAGISKEELT